MTMKRRAGSLIAALILLAVTGTPLCAQKPAAGASAAPRFVGEPGLDVSDGRLEALRLVGLPPEARVRIEAERCWKRRAPRQWWRSAVEVRSDKTGVVDLAKQVPLAGSYQRADRLGLFWSMERTDEGCPAAASADSVRLRARLDGREVTSAVVQLRREPMGVRIQQVSQAGLVGLYARPRDRPGRLPAVLLLGGSEGGLETGEDLAALIAERGYAVFALAYVSTPRNPIPGFPDRFAEVPVELAERARAWLAMQEKVETSRVAVVGVSKGAELGLLLAATFPWVQAVVAFAPSDVVWEGWQGDYAPLDVPASSWSAGGRPVPWIRQLAEDWRELKRPMVEQHRLDRQRSADSLAAAAIPIERAHAAVLLVAGGRDLLWPSAEMAASLRRRWQSANRPAERLSVLLEPEAGHDVMGTGFDPMTRLVVRHGGTAEASARAQERSWAAMFEWLARYGAGSSETSP
jgi:dienelactone hydrolase